MIKNLLLVLITCLIGTVSKAQTFSASVVQQPTCYGMCNGSVTFTTSTVTGPFTMVMTNSASCPNSTVSNSNQTSITVSSVCPCSSDYTVSIFSGTVLVGVDYVQFPVTSTAALAVNISSTTPATCSSCCTGSANIAWSGGNTTFTSPTITIDGNTVTTYTPAGALCPGTHTVCATDLSNCVACNVFNIGVSVTTGFDKNKGTERFLSLYPNPVSDDLVIEAAGPFGITYLKILDISGKKLLTVRCEGLNKASVITTTLEEGIYFAEVHTSSGEIFRKMFIKKSI